MVLLSLILDRNPYLWYKYTMKTTTIKQHKKIRALYRSNVPELCPIGILLRMPKRNVQFQHRRCQF